MGSTEPLPAQQTAVQTEASSEPAEFASATAAWGNDEASEGTSSQMTTQEMLLHASQPRDGHQQIVIESPANVAPSQPIIQPRNKMDSSGIGNNGRGGGQGQHSDFTHKESMNHLIKKRLSVTSIDGKHSLTRWNKVWRRIFRFARILSNDGVPLVPHEFEYNDRMFGRRRTIFERLHIVLIKPMESRIGFYTFGFILILIVLSCFTYVLETMPSMQVFVGECAVCEPVKGDDYLCSNPDNKECVHRITGEEYQYALGNRTKQYEFCRREDCQPVPAEWLQATELFAVIVFTVEYILALLTSTVARTHFEKEDDRMIRARKMNAAVQRKPSKLMSAIELGQHIKLESDAEGTLSRNHMIVNTEEQSAEISIDEYVRTMGRQSRGTFGGESEGPASGTLNRVQSLYVSKVLFKDQSNSSRTPRLLERRRTSNLIYLERMWHFMTKPQHIVDVLAILPFYIEKFTNIPSLTFVRIIRLFRMVRIARVARMGKNIAYLTESMLNIIYVVRTSFESLMVALFCTAILMIILAAITYAFEKGEINHYTGIYERRGLSSFSPKEDSPFESIPTTFWWVLVSFTTVGYGDIVPTTDMGRFIGVIVMYVGIVFLAMPITVISANYQALYDARRERLRYERDCTMKAARVLIMSLLAPDTEAMRYSFEKWITLTKLEIEKSKEISAVIRRELRAALADSGMSNAAGTQRPQQHDQQGKMGGDDGADVAVPGVSAEQFKQLREDVTSQIDAMRQELVILFSKSTSKPPNQESSAEDDDLSMS